jgi:hypothetical protein
MGKTEMTEALQQLMPQIKRLTAEERRELYDFVLATLERDRSRRRETESEKDAEFADKPLIAEGLEELP